MVLVHSNAESAAVWDPLVAELGRDDIVRVSPPGFGAPLPDGFDTTPEGNRRGLIAELEALGEPVDLVGHDWGGRTPSRSPWPDPICCAAGPVTPSACSNPTTSGTSLRWSGSTRNRARRPSPRG